MGLNCGIVGLPNVGKSTIFSALTSAPAEAANYPFCTIDPNVGVVNVPDKRLYRIADIIEPQNTIPAIVEFVDIAGLVKGASEGEGLGNQFLANVREVGVVCHVVRCFEDADITHVSGSIDPDSDIEIINIELALADLETVEKRKKKLERSLKSHDRDVAKRAKQTEPLLERLSESLSQGIPARSVGFTAEETALLEDLHLITMKKQMYVCNVDEDGLHGSNAFVEQVKKRANAENSEVVVICGKLEAEIALLETEEERSEFLREAGLEESGLAQLIHTGYEMLGLRTFFTAGEKEVRAWTFHQGSTAKQAAGVIHTDFEKGFIKAEVYHCSELFEFGSEQKLKEKGKIRTEGKEYPVKDGDVMYFKFNV